MVIFRVAKLKLPAREVVLKRQAARMHKASWRERARCARRVEVLAGWCSVWLLAFGSLGSRPRRMRTLVQVSLRFMHNACSSSRHTTPCKHASFPIKVQVTIQGCKVDGWMDVGCRLPSTDRLVKEQHDSLHSTQPTRLQLAKCQPSTALFLRLSRRLAAWPVGGTVYECRVTNRPTGPRETDSVQTLCSNSVRSIPPS